MQEFKIRTAYKLLFNRTDIAEKQTGTDKQIKLLTEETV